ncbi:MAG: phosphoribosylanthranilate isomerase [Bacteroidota bacterium]
MLKIKVCGLRDIENISDVVKAAPDFMGFIFWQGSERSVGNNPAAILFRQIPPGLIKTGVFVNEKIPVVNKTINSFSLNAVQFHGSESPDYCRQFREAGYLTIKAFGIEERFDFNMLLPYLDSCDYFLFDTKTPGFGGSGKKFDKNILDDYKFDKLFFISGGIEYDDIDEIKNFGNKRLFGIDINSRFETSPGIKNAGLLKSFIDEIRKI